MTQHTCPLCSYPLLRHIRPGKLYWFCRHCYQETFTTEEMSRSIGQSDKSLSHTVSQPQPATMTLPTQPKTQSETPWLDQDNTGSSRTRDRLQEAGSFANTAPYPARDDLREEAFSGISETYLRISLIARFECSGVELEAIRQPAY